MSKIAHIPVGKFSVAQVVKEINKHIEGRNVEGIFFNPVSLMKGTIEIHTSDPQINAKIIERPSKFKKNASSRFYCVYRKGNGWTYKFVNKKLSNKAFYGKIYDDEMDAAWAYDKHRFSIEGDLSKLNFPEHFEVV